MSPVPKLRVLPGVAAGLLPLLFLAAWGGLLVVWLGGLGELSRILGMAGPSIHRMAALILVTTATLELTLFLVGAWRGVPLALPVLLALVPWWWGVLGALRGMPQVFTAVAGIPPEDRGLILLQGAAELQCLRLLGAWASASLLMATAAGLLIASLRRRDASEEPALWEAAERRLEAVLVALLAAVAWLAAFEALQVTRIFVAVVGADAADRDTLLAYGADQLKLLELLRMGAVGGAVLAFLALGRRRMEQRPRQTVALISLGLTVCLVAGTLGADGRPLARMRDAIEQANAR
jgi:hypothetical protein